MRGPQYTVGVNESVVNANIRNNLITPVQITCPGKRPVTKYPLQRKSGICFSLWSLCEKNVRFLVT